MTRVRRSDHRGTPVPVTPRPSGHVSPETKDEPQLTVETIPPQTKKEERKTFFPLNRQSVNETRRRKISQDYSTTYRRRSRGRTSLPSSSTESKNPVFQGSKRPESETYLDLGLPSSLTRPTLVCLYVWVSGKGTEFLLDEDYCLSVHLPVIIPPYRSVRVRGKAHVPGRERCLVLRDRDFL